MICRERDRQTEQLSISKSSQPFICNGDMINDLSPNIRVSLRDHNAFIDQRIDNSPSLEIWKTSFRVRISGVRQERKTDMGGRQTGEREGDRRVGQGRRDGREKET